MPILISLKKLRYNINTVYVDVVREILAVYQSTECKGNDILIFLIVNGTVT